MSDPLFNSSMTFLSVHGSRICRFYFTFLAFLFVFIHVFFYRARNRFFRGGITNINIDISSRLLHHQQRMTRVRLFFLKLYSRPLLQNCFCVTITSARLRHENVIRNRAFFLSVDERTTRTIDYRESLETPPSVSRP